MLLKNFYHPNAGVKLAVPSQHTTRMSGTSFSNFCSTKAIRRAFTAAPMAAYEQAAASSQQPAASSQQQQQQQQQTSEFTEMEMDDKSSSDDLESSTDLHCGHLAYH
eukprot:1650728-Amphidinium_carterae.1